MGRRIGLGGHHAVAASRVLSAALAIAIAALGGSALGGCSTGGTTGPGQGDRTPGTLFAADTTASVGVAPWALAIADFDTDGTPDIAVASIGSRSLRLFYNGPGGAIFHRKATSPAWDTTFAFRPRALAAADVNSDGLPDLVVSLLDSSIAGATGRLVVLLNRGRPGVRPPSYTVGLDTAAGVQVRDLFIGDLDAADDGVEIVAASSKGVSVVVLSRPASAARPAGARDNTINFVGSLPATGAVGVGLSAPIVVWFDVDVRDTTKLKRPGWVEVLGQIAGEAEPRQIAIRRVIRRTTYIDNVSYTQYHLVPNGLFRPNEAVTVTLTDSIEGNLTPPVRLAAPKTISFVAEGLRVAASYPADGATDIPAEASIRLAFNWWLSPPSVAAAFELRYEDGTTITADRLTTRYDAAAREVTIVPPEPFPSYERVQVIMKGVLRDSLGQASFAGDTLAFEATGPQVVATLPPNGVIARLDEGMPAGYGRVVLRFNAPMAVPTGGNPLRVVGSQSGGHGVGPFAPVGTDGRTISAAVSGAFVAGEWVTLTATSGFISTRGFPLAKPCVWRFIVRPRAAATLRPSGGTVGATLAGGTVAGGRFTVADRGIVLADTSGALGLFTRGAAGWTETATLSADHGRRIIRAADLDGDGLLDLVAARPDSSIVEVFMNHSGGGSTPLFASPVTYSVGMFPASLFLGDLDGDGSVDIATANMGTNDVSVLLNDGAGLFGRETYYVVGDHPQAIDGADLDGDGDIDLVVANSTGNSMTLLRNRTATKPRPAK